MGSVSGGSGNDRRESWISTAAANAATTGETGTGWTADITAGARQASTTDALPPTMTARIVSVLRRISFVPMKKIKGYKGMELDMTCRGMRFKIGETYHVDGNISVCHNGIHFCERLSDVFDFYERDKHRFFEVEAVGIIKKVGSKSATSDMKIIRELDDIEINRTCYGNGDGYGYGYGDGNGYGYGYGYGDGNGYGNGYGYGYGYGYGGNIQKILLFV